MLLFLHQETLDWMNEHQAEAGRTFIIGLSVLCVHAGHKAQKDTFLDLQGLDFKNWTGTAQFTKSPSSCALDMEEGRSVAGARKSTVFFVICTKA